MAEAIQGFYVELMQTVASRADASGELTRTTLVEELVDRLISAEELQDWTPCYYQGRGFRNRNLAIDGYFIDEISLDASVSIIVADYSSGDTPARLSTAEISAIQAQAVNFVVDALDGRLHSTLEPSIPAADLARELFLARDGIRTVRVLLITNSLVGPRFRDVERQPLEGKRIELHLWDLARFEKLTTSGGREAVDIDLTAFVQGGLPVLPAGIGEAGYAAFLGVVPGALLADLYDTYGSRLLEGNVRAFLSTRAKINKEIRRTIVNRPSRFFAFNNGITATATSVELTQQDNFFRIVRVRNLQIVNGGQTTASLYNARVKDKAELGSVFVQMKLSVLLPEVADSMIPEISRYANTQNKVSDADLFANHPFHRRVEELSRRIWSPVKLSTRHMTHWFYERARAQYQTEQSRLDGAKKREFFIQNPKEQVITKTDLAKYENSWLKLPHIVSLGAQKNFVKFAESVADAYERRPDDFNERWFYHLVAKAIFFTSAEDVISRASWYTRAFRANIVTYAVARFLLLVEQKFPGYVIDLDRIWKAQQISPTVGSQLDSIGEMVLKILVSPPAPYANVTEWAKRPQCWDKVAATSIQPVEGLEGDLKRAEDERGDRNRARDLQKEGSAITAVADVVRLSQSGLWKRARDWPSGRRILSEAEHKLLAIAANRGVRFVPADFQAQQLLLALKRLQDAGFTG